MDAHVVNFTLRPLPLSMFPRGGYQGYLEGRPTYTFEMLLAEVNRRYPGTDPKQLRTDAEHLLDTAASLAEERLANVQLGDYILLRPYMGGKFEKANSRFDPAKHSVNLRALCRKELKPDFSQWTFHNATNEKAMRVDSVNSVGAASDTEVTLGCDLEVNGGNLNLLADRPDLEPKDRVEFHCTKPDGTTLSGEVEVVSSSIHTITCRWPAALDASSVGGMVTFSVYGRCNDPDAMQQTASTREVVILAGEEPPVPEPTLEKVTAPGHEDDPDWVNKVSRDGQIVILGTGFTNAVTAEFSSDGTPETFNVTARTATSITGQIAGGLEAGGTLVMELRDGDNVIDTASVEVVE